jgi:hypothetical protein
LSSLCFFRPCANYNKSTSKASTKKFKWHEPQFSAALFQVLQERMIQRIFLIDKTG